MPGAGIRAQRGGPAVPRGSAGGLQRRAAAGAAAAERAEPALLRAGPGRGARAGRAGAARPAQERYVGRELTRDWPELHTG